MICDKIIADKNCNTIVQNEEFDPRYVYIYIIQLNKYDGTTVSQTFVRTEAEQEIIFTIGQDGFYTLCRLRISKDENDKYYYKDDQFYKDIDQISSLTEILNINLESFEDQEHIGIQKTYWYYFQLCRLRRCYVNIASKIINDTATIKCEKTLNKFDTYRRDLLWSAINVITYLAETEQFEEAERLVERIMGCNGLCDSDEKNSCGCGCGR